MTFRRATQRVVTLAVFAAVAFGGAFYYETFRFPERPAADLTTAVADLRAEVPGLRVEYGYDGCHPLKVGCGDWFASATVTVSTLPRVRLDIASVFDAAVSVLPVEFGDVSVGAPVDSGVDPDGIRWVRAPVTFSDGSTHELQCQMGAGSGDDSPSAGERIACSVTVPL